MALAEFTVQVGAFKNHDKAVRLATQLQDQGFPATPSPPERNPGNLTRVRVGPYPDRESADIMRSQLLQAGLKGFVVHTTTPGTASGSTRTSLKSQAPPRASSAADPTQERTDDASGGSGPAMSGSPEQPRILALKKDPEDRPASEKKLPPFVLPIVLREGKSSGFIALEARLFPHDPVDPSQHGNNLSFYIQPEFHTTWANGRQSLTFEPFYRWDQHDDERTHADIRELLWQIAADSWELRAGISKVFWGVAESQHLVDIINQTDLVENIDREDKLGQPMINLALIRDFGTVDLFLLPGFRERTFPGQEGRLRSLPRVDVDNPLYASAAEEKHVDFAIRWSHYIGDWDFGLAHFAGTSRDPRFVPDLRPGGEMVLVPLYDTIDQTSLDLQATKGDWLWKLEWLTRSGQGDRYTALVGGFEYTAVGILDTSADLGVIGEYHFDDRGESAPTPFEDDIMVGLRLALNDMQSTEALFGIISDLDTSGKSFNLEASRRIGENWMLELEARFFSNIPLNDAMFSFRNDDYLQIELARYF